MKWLLVSALVFLVFTRRHLVGALLQSVRGLPEDYRRGRQRADDPAAAAKDVRPR